MHVRRLYTPQIALYICYIHLFVRTNIYIYTSLERLRLVEEGWPWSGLSVSGAEAGRVPSPALVTCRDVDEDVEEEDEEEAVSVSSCSSEHIFWGRCRLRRALRPTFQRSIDLPPAR